MTQIALSDIVTDAGTQVRVQPDDATVADYAQQMTDGAQFPPVVLFHDGNQYFLADGFHRVLAARRNDWRAIDADVRVGTKTDALWFALAANKANGRRLTEADKKHAILLALKAWPDRSSTQIGDQIGCTNAYVGRIREQVHTSMNLPDRVTGKDGKSYPASRRQDDAKTAAIKEALQAGKRVREVAREFKTGDAEVGAIAREIGRIDVSKSGVETRVATIRQMAANGYTTRQIADKVGLTEGGCKNTMRREGIIAPADSVVAKHKRHDANRIIDQIVTDAENLTSGADLIVFEDADPERLGEWITSLVQSKKALSQLITRLQKEQSKHGQAA